MALGTVADDILADDPGGTADGPDATVGRGAKVKAGATLTPALLSTMLINTPQPYRR